MCGIGYIVYGFMAQSGANPAVAVAVSFLVTLGLLGLALKGLNTLTLRSESGIETGRRIA